MSTTKTPTPRSIAMAARKAAAVESAARIAAAQAETLAIVRTGVCPKCGGKLQRNFSLSGWWQCSQFGAVTHRARPEAPPCSWQGFTE